MVRNKKLLVIEDDPAVQGTINRDLRIFPVEVLQAHSVVEAEKFLREDPDIDLILLDGCLDGENPDGFAFIEDCLELSDAPIVAMSKSRDLRKMMLDKGCKHEVEEKRFAAHLVAKLLAFK